MVRRRHGLLAPAAELGDTAWSMLNQDGVMLGEGDEPPALHRRIGDVILVHAGVQPKASDPEAWIGTADPMALDDDHPLWIREPFLAHPGVFGDGLFVVHGHTHKHSIRRRDGSSAAPGEHRHDGWQLALDGGSSATGIVSAAILEDGRYRIVSCQGSRVDDPGPPSRR